MDVVKVDFRNISVFKQKKPVLTIRTGSGTRCYFFDRRRQLRVPRFQMLVSIGMLRQHETVALYLSASLFMKSPSFVCRR
jgi:hypothetical protein